ncbi:helix-turn-helix transcriptional regulator [Azospirillum lipoferum]|uniref:helix-turn-helix transcriptional regulator n=1 Tax=Azospirillum lipoferum TaxID=193 RepID=UPI0009D96845|nr:helix-turn-helix transcriptional regulator [Azospirillum lipoferum]
MLNEALRLLRVFHDLSQKDLAAKLGVTKSYISEIEAGKKVPTLQLLERYAQVYNIPLSSIMFFSENIGKEGTAEKTRQFVSEKVLRLMAFIAERSGKQGDDEEDQKLSA